MTLAVTGGIGSGKSLVCSMFARRGVPVYDSDSRTKELYGTVPGLPGRISSALGTDISSPDGGVDRGRLASVVFRDPAKLKILEDVVYPEVLKDFTGWRDSMYAGGCSLVIIESAVILEKPLFKDIADKVLIVDAPVELRLERAAARDGADKEKILARMQNQRLFSRVSGGETISGVDFIIVNDGTAASLERKVEAVYRKLTAGDCPPDRMSRGEAQQ